MLCLCRSHVSQCHFHNVIHNLISIENVIINFHCMQFLFQAAYMWIQHVMIVKEVA